jgi:hypothetical protein
MALPKIDVPIYDVNLISTGKKVRFRPFTVKEEKLFLMANESESSNTTVDTIIQVLNNCVLDDIDVTTLPLFDIEYLFLNLRARSISEEVNLRYKCNNQVDDGNGGTKTCNHVVELDVNVLEVQPEKNPAHTAKIQISPKLGIMMKYPRMDMLDEKATDELDIVLNLIIDCIDYIYDEEEVYYAKDSTREELLEFLDSLQAKDLEKLKEFFETMPKLKKKLDFTCTKCGYHENIEIEGLQSFFA